MRKELLFTAAALSATVFATTVFADGRFPGLQKNEVGGIETNIEETLPAELLNFLKTPRGSAFTATQVLEAMKQRPIKITMSDNYTVETRYHEDFSGFTEGEVGNPKADPEPDSDDSSLLKESGTTIYLVHQAGGTAYEGFRNISEPDPGYVMTRGVDVSDGDRIWKVSCRAMNANPDAQDQLLQGFFLDQIASTTISASALPLKYNEWVDCEWLLTGGTAGASAMLFGWKGKVYIDDIKIEQVKYPLAMPKVVSAIRTAADKILVKWEKVAGATGYRVAATESFDARLFGEEECGNVDEFELTIEPQDDMPDQMIIYVTALDGDKSSYPGHWTGELIPDEIGECEALEASDISADGFTANWTPASGALNYLVAPTQKTVAAETEEVVVIDEDFKGIPTKYTDMNPAMVSPLLGMGNLDMLLSRSGWQTDLSILFYLAEDMPCLVLTNMYAAMGIPGTLISPVADFSGNDGKVTVSGMALSAAGDIILEAGFLDSSDQMENPVEIEFGEGVTGMFEEEISGGKENSRFAIRLGDCTEDETMLAVLNLKVTKTLNAGESIEIPFISKRAAYNETSARFNTPVDEGHSYTYSVLPYYSDTFTGEMSNSVTVKTGSGVKDIMSNLSGVRVSSSDGVLEVWNNEGSSIEVYSATGMKIGATAATYAQFNVGTGIYIVRAGDRSFKVMCR